jgi:predicted MFS family arabinose efflux permease
MSVGQGAILIGLINGSSGFGRIMLGLNSDIFGQLNTLWVCLSLAASSILLIWPLSTNFGGLIFFSLMYGFFAGGFISLLPTCIVQLFGTKDIGTITGMVYTGFFFGNLCGPPLSGAMIDALTTVDPSTGLQTINYIPSIIFSGVCILTASFILLSTKIKISNGVFFEKI